MTKKSSTDKNPHWFKSGYQKKFDLNLGDLLNETRRSLGYSRETFLSELNHFYNEEQFISKDHYARVERGERSISTYKLILLIKFFNHAIDIHNNKNNTRIDKITFERLYNITKI